MSSTARARGWHILTAAVAGVALVAQLILVITGVAVLVPERTPPLPIRIWQFFSYFTVQSNLLVLVGAVTLARDPGRDGPGWRVLRLATLIGITVTGLVAATLLAPLLNLTGLNWLLDKLLHVVSPVLALAGWLIFGPRPRIDRRVVVLTLIWPVVWLVYTLIVGAARGWYPYPFLDPRPAGAGPVIISCAGITVVFVVLAALFGWLDRRLPPTGSPAR